MALRARARSAARSRRAAWFAVCFIMRRAAVIVGGSLDGVLILVRPYMKWLGDGEADNLVTLRVEADDGVVVHFEPAAVDFGVDDFLALLDFVAEDDLLGGAEELEHGQQLSRRVGVALDGVVDAGAEHLAQVLARHPARRDV